jgi:hypothetical protein
MGRAACRRAHVRIAEIMRTMPYDSRHFSFVIHRAWLSFRNGAKQVSKLLDDVED